MARPSCFALKDRPVTCSRSGCGALAVGLWRAEDGTTPIYTSEAGDETFLVLSGAVASSVLWLREASKAMRRVARSAAASSTDSWRFGRP